ncbi:MAG: hypothetical protein K9L21_05370 [Spirochaetia bacterium]|nr:hypothetical protein [Spirochaetia bacterium]
MKHAKCTFAIFFGNRSLFPASFMESTRREMLSTLHQLGHSVLSLPTDATRYGAIETVDEGIIYANFLKQHDGEFDGIILCLPNFGDETGAIAALKHVQVPIFIHAYPDNLDEMGPAQRRDAFCGKISIMDLFKQYGIRFTVQKPHVVNPGNKDFTANINYFDTVCRVVKSIRGMTVGAIGARTTPFKTVRIDEIALQRHDITVETLDLADIIFRVNSLNHTKKTQEKKHQMQAIASFADVPQPSFDNIVKLGVVLDDIIDEYKLDTLAIRCWLELQKELHISPCVLACLSNERMVPIACELDVGSAITMHALSAATTNASACLDWNNNYGEDQDKCILFHCGSVPPSLMTAKGKISDHLILANEVGPGCGFGCNIGRIRPVPFMFGNLLTDSGQMKFYLGTGVFTEDPVPMNYFGCFGVAQINRLQDVLMHIGELGHRHHVCIAEGDAVTPLTEALTKYLGCQVSVPQL